MEEEGEDHVEEIVVGDVEDENNEVASKVSVSMKNHSLVVEVEGAPNMPESPIITENGKTHHLTEVREWPGSRNYLLYSKGTGVSYSARFS